MVNKYATISELRHIINEKIAYGWNSTLRDAIYFIEHPGDDEYEPVQHTNPSRLSLAHSHDGVLGLNTLSGFTKSTFGLRDLDGEGSRDLDGDGNNYHDGSTLAEALKKHHLFAEDYGTTGAKIVYYGNLKLRYLGDLFHLSDYVVSSHVGTCEADCNSPQSASGPGLVMVPIRSK